MGIDLFLNFFVTAFLAVLYYGNEHSKSSMISSIRRVTATEKSIRITLYFLIYLLVVIIPWKRRVCWSKEVYSKITILRHSYCKRLIVPFIWIIAFVPDICSYSYAKSHWYSSFKFFDKIFRILKRIFFISLREKYPNKELFLVHIFLYSVRIQENTYQK